MNQCIVDCKFARNVQNEIYPMYVCELSENVRILNRVSGQYQYVDRLGIPEYKNKACVLYADDECDRFQLKTQQFKRVNNCIINWILIRMYKFFVKRKP